MSLNRVMLIGRLGRDPEARATPSGTKVATFGLATSEKWTDKQGEKQERTEWHNIVSYARIAELAEKYLAKGREVYVEGKLSTREWEDKSGSKRKTTEVIATNIVFLGSANDGGAKSRPATDSDPITDEDIPF